MPQPKVHASGSNLVIHHHGDSARRLRGVLGAVTYSFPRADRELLWHQTLFREVRAVMVHLAEVASLLGEETLLSRVGVIGLNNWLLKQADIRDEIMRLDVLVTACHHLLTRQSIILLFPAFALACLVFDLVSLLHLFLIFWRFDNRSWDTLASDNWDRAVDYLIMVDIGRGEYAI